MNPGQLSARQKGKLLLVVAVMAVLLALAVRGGGNHVLSVQETIRLLRQLPYRYTFRQVPLPKGAEAAVAGRAVGAHHTVVNFGIALGRHATGVPVPRAGVMEGYYYLSAGFALTDDLLVPGKNGQLKSGPQFHTGAQWREAEHMTREIEEKLCLGATGKRCPVGV